MEIRTNITVIYKLLEGAVVVDDAAVGPTRAVLAAPNHPLGLLGVLPQAADQRGPDKQ